MERRCLQFAMILAACVPIYGGLFGVLKGAQAAFGAWPGARRRQSYAISVGSCLLAIGVVYLGCVPAVERRGNGRPDVLTFLVLAGGLSRLAGVFISGDPGSMRWTLAMELGVAPLLSLWQTRVAASSPNGAFTLHRRTR